MRSRRPGKEAAIAVARTLRGGDLGPLDGTHVVATCRQVTKWKGRWGNVAAERCSNEATIGDRCPGHTAAGLFCDILKGLKAFIYFGQCSCPADMKFELHVHSCDCPALGAAIDE
jgi:hypothetical protein